MDNSRVGEGVAYSETSRWKAVSFRKTIAKEIAKAILVNWPQAMEGSTPLIMGSAERIEENVFASAKDGEKRALLEEIKEAKMLLLDAELVFNEADIIPSMAPGASGLIVELRFIGVTIDSDFMSHLASNQMSIKPLRLRIPTNYPNSSPILLDEMPSESSDRAVDLSTIAKLKLQYSLRSLDDPLSIKSIALSWEKCVRVVMSAYDEESGVGKFGFRYGGWRDF
ncbi:hypothetical protein K1719_013575 [Acacia pycnantha]|nr:hypothetical protein K1719_013575 [Acacia pycnantha]